MNKRQRIVLENETLLKLWDQARAGDSVAFCQLAEKQYRTLFNYAINFCNDRDFAKDAIQDLLIHIWEKREHINIQYVNIYFLKALRNQLLQGFRKTNRSYTFIDLESANFISDNENAETVIEQRESFLENKNRLKNAIEDLPKRQKEAIFLKFYEGLENEQIADLMQVNRQSVANLLFKAISTLKIQIPVIQILLVSLAGIFPI